MSICTTTTATAATAPKATRSKGSKGPDSKALRLAFNAAFDSIQALAKTRGAVSRASKQYFESVAAGYDADPAVLINGNQSATDAALEVASRIQDLDAMSGVRFNAEDARMAGLSNPDSVNGSRLASMLREAIGNKKTAKESAERLRG